MTQYWIIPERPNEQLSLRDLAQKVSQGHLTESTWLVNSETQINQQVYDIPGLDNAVRKLNATASNGAPGVTEANRPCLDGPRQHSPIPQDDVPPQQPSMLRMILSTRPHAGLVVVSVAFVLCSLGSWYYNNWALLRFPPPLDSPAYRVLPVIGEVVEMDFWVIQACLILASVVAFEMAILFGERKERVR